MMNSWIIDYTKRLLKQLIVITEDRRKSLMLLVLLWSIIHLISYFHFGILSPIDTSYYLKNANALLADKALEPRAWWYLSYISICAFALKTGLFPYFNIGLQLLFSVLSVAGLYQLSIKLSGNNITGFLAGIFMIIWIKFAQWNFILYTDSLFTSSVVLSMVGLTSKKRLWQSIAVLMVLFAIFMRPTGIGFLFALIITWYIHIAGAKRIKHVMIIPLITCVGLVINYMLADFIYSFLESYQKGIIIYPDITYDLGQDALHIPNKQSSPIWQLLEFFFYNFWYTIKSFSLKAGLFLVHIKSYYSVHHNIYILSILIPCYILTIKSSLTLPKSRLKTFSICFIIIQTVIIGLTSENWDGRFLLPTLPWVFLLASGGFVFKKTLSNSDYP